MLRILILSSLLLLTTTYEANASWVNSGGQVETLTLYSHNQILVKLKNNNGASVASCSNKEYFIIPASYAAESRNRIYSTLLAAKISMQEIILSYNDVGNCEAWGSSPNVYRKITRISF